MALKNFASLVKPGGILLIDHRNYDYILDKGRAPSRNIYYNSQYVSDIKTSVIYQNGAPAKIVLDYVMGSPKTSTDTLDNQCKLISSDPRDNEFTLSYYPHRMNDFKQLLNEAFNGQASIETFGDFKPLGELSDPAFFIHICRRNSDDVGTDEDAAWQQTSSGEESV